MLVKETTPPDCAVLFDEFVANREKLAAFLRARLGPNGGADVDDLMQELWLKVAAVDPADICNPRSYLFQAAHNLALNRARDRARRLDREAHWRYVAVGEGDGVEDAVAERNLLAREQLAAIDAALRSDGKRAARIFRRSRIDGIDRKRIAMEFNVSLSTVEKDLRAAYRALLLLKDGRQDAG